ncbi:MULTISPECIES: phosphatase PAP2 family protein [unclassified Duganella]|uniref:phosphatase PAP2 family protein n=1 Tax=unclassified Duganella TaxID=2636909 RepID=UPI00087E2ECD|nr:MULTISPECIES: phosphatase PAP2 family protein [unclassified Duganella]SDH23449.1 autotransporter-associated beta strand repeat-containing protein [Duganella sp. OV458]SDK45066.1 autotransporter-associated beta strand repeat-containing protein [Duganella sp. OV510]
MQLLPARPLILALSIAAALSACGGSDHDEPLVVPAAPADQGAAEVVAVPSATAFVDTVATNQRGDARYATLATNAGVRILGGMLNIWKPLTEIVDAGVTAPAVDNFPAVVASAWTGVPNDGNPDGTVVNAAVHQANIDYVIKATTNRSAEQAVQAYLDDRRGKGYSITDGMGPLTAAWRAAAQQTTTITDVAADATSKLYNDGGNNTGVAGSANATFGSVVDLVNLVGNNASTEPAKRFYKYARPYRWSSNVQLLPALVPAKSATPATDGGFTSGHTAEAVRDAVAMAYAVPERYQEMLSRGLELGEMRVLAGMHSPLDVVSGRMLGQASAAANLADPANAAKKTAAVAQAHTALMAATNTTADTFATYAQSGTVANDRFANYATNKANYLRRSTYGFAQIAATNAAVAVPKGAEVLLETRQPYLSDAQRRVVLKTTALASGYPVMDDAEGWGRLNLFAAADGYAAFSGNVTIVMDASKGGFNAVDRWRNDISGAGKLVKQGSGTLKLAGANTWTGGTELSAGTLQGDSVAAFGAGDVYNSGGTLVANAPSALKLSGKYTQLSGSTTLELDIGAAAAGSQGTLTVGGTATIAGGTLRIKFANGYKPKAGDVLNVISAGSLKGKFNTITVDGFSNVTANYGATALTLTLG